MDNTTDTTTDTTTDVSEKKTREQVDKETELNTPETVSFLRESLIHYQNLRALSNPYYDFNSLDDKWNEYERCFNIQATASRGSNEYKGFSNVVLPDFHEKIETLRTREINSLFSGANQFITKAQKDSSKEAAKVAKLLVDYNFRCVDLRTQVSLLDLDKLLYGTWHAYCPFEEKDVVSTETINFLVNPDTGKQQLVDGIPQSVPPYKSEVTRKLKYTNLIRLPIQHVFVNPELLSIDEQEVVFILLKKSYKDLLKMEEDGIIDAGEAEYIKNYAQTQASDFNQASRDQQITNENGTVRSEIQAFDLYLTYFYKEEEGKRKLFEAIYVDQCNRISGIREYPKMTMPIKKGVHIQGRAYYGIGMGDEMYPVYIAKNTRINQVIDKSTWEVLGGGLFDPKHLPGFSELGLAPGVWKAVHGLTNMSANRQSPILGVNEILRDARASMGFEMLPILDQAMQAGTGATRLLSGQPTNSQVDRTIGGIEATIAQSDERINAYLKDFEDQCLKKFAEECYDNYQRYLDMPVDLKEMLDPVDLSYVDDMGQPMTVDISTSLRGVTFVFQATSRVMKTEEETNKFLKFLSILQQAVATNPTFGEQLLRMVDLKFMLEEIARNLEIGDMDKIFPPINYMQTIDDLEKQLRQEQFKNQATGMVIQAAKAKLQDEGQTSALDSINEVEQAASSSMQGQQGGGR